MTTVLQLDVVPVLVVGPPVLAYQGQDPHGTCSVYRVWTLCDAERTAVALAVVEQGVVGDAVEHTDAKESLAT